MRRAQAIAALQDKSPALKARGATALYLFGSTVRDAASDSSDLDVFIDYDPAGHFSLLKLAGIKNWLEDELGVAVDITTRDSLHPALRDAIESSAERIF